MLALHIPEEDRCIDIFELIEHEKLLRLVSLALCSAKSNGLCSAQSSVLKTVRLLTFFHEIAFSPLE